MHDKLLSCHTILQSTDNVAITLLQYSTAQQRLGYLSSLHYLCYLSTKQDNIILQVKRNVNMTVLAKSAFIVIMIIILTSEAFCLLCLCRATQSKDIYSKN